MKFGHVMLVVAGLIVTGVLVRKDRVAVADSNGNESDIRLLQADLTLLKEQVGKLREAPATTRQTDPGKLLADDFVDVKRFGAKGDGATDDTAAFQAALEAAGNNSPWGVRGTLIIVPPGEYLLSRTLNVYRMSFEMTGCGFGNSPAYQPSPGKASVLRWNGPPDMPMMKIRDSAGISIRRLRWEGKAGVGGTTAIDLNWVAADQQGTNGRTSIEQCHFGRYMHTPQGIQKGDLACGILMDGENGNNDEFQIHKCIFSNCTSAGVRIANTQSVWGTINDCTISEGGVGVETAASLTANNLCFDACNPDFKINSTAHVSVWGWQSERSKRLAQLSPDAALIADSGYLQLGAIVGDVMIDAFPSESSEIILRDMFFTENTRKDRPYIRFGPSQPDRVVGSNFRVRVIDSTGLYPDQFRLAGEMWAQVPASRGEVEFAGRSDKFYQFHNYLRMTPPAARQLDPSRIDLPLSDNPSFSFNAPTPLGVQWTGAKVYAGNGSPENLIVAATGSLYLRTDGDHNSTLYVKEHGAGATGWAAH